MVDIDPDPEVLNIKDEVSFHLSSSAVLDDVQCR